MIVRDYWVNKLMYRAKLHDDERFELTCLRFAGDLGRVGAWLTQFAMRLIRVKDTDYPGE